MLIILEMMQVYKLQHLNNPELRSQHQHFEVDVFSWDQSSTRIQNKTTSRSWFCYFCLNLADGFAIKDAGYSAASIQTCALRSW